MPTLGILPASTPDDRLVDQCLKGSEEAWSALIDKYKRLIFSIPVRQGFSADDSSEIFQEVCLALSPNCRNCGNREQCPPGSSR